MFLLHVAIAAYFHTLGIAEERTASLVVLPPLVLGYDELYANPMVHSEETMRPNNTKNAKLSDHNNTAVNYETGDMYGDSEFLNQDTIIEESIDNVTSHRDCIHDNNLKELQIVGKLVFPQKIFACRCPNGEHTCVRKNKQ